MKPSTTAPVVRFAPSPTGFLHMGGVRGALFNFLFARKNNGTYALRIEDTDKERSREEWTEGLIADLAWLGLHHDVFAKQSERTALYESALQKLVASGHAYVSKEVPTEEGQRDEVIRFKNPNIVVTFEDMIRGTVSVDTTDLGDFVIARSMTDPVYHFAVVVDDGDMGMTHVIRGEEHLSNTPRQILIQEALGLPRPIYAHLPLVLAEDKSKLSKRKHGETVSLTYYRTRGYLPSAIINFVALLGWNPGTDQELFSLDELITLFDISKVQKGGAVFNVEKLNWINREHIKKLSPEERLNAVSTYAPESYDRGVLARIVDIVLEHVDTFGDIPACLEDLGFFFTAPAYEASGLIWKNSNLSETKTHVQYVLEALRALPGGFAASPETIKAVIWDYAEKMGRGNVLWPVRFALTGKERSPDPFTVASVIGIPDTIARLERALELLA